MAAEKTTIELSKPIEFAGEKIGALEFDELRAEHLMHLPTDRAPNVGELLHAAALACGQSMGLLKRLSVGDVGKVLAHVGAALAPFPETGGTPSPPSQESSAGDPAT